MTLAFITNLVNHHQLPLADEFYKRLGDSYYYISTEPMPEWLVQGGYDESLDRPYVIRTYRSNEEMAKAREIIDICDVVIMGAGPIDWVLDRKEKNRITFHYSERWLKRIDYNAISLFNLQNVYKHYWRFRNSRCYMLCASAFTASDMKFYHIFPHKCFKWGYFTHVDDFNISFYRNNKDNDSVKRLMWCARFLDWKHPELPVLLAERLKRTGYHFVIDMFGGGEMFEEIKKMVHEKGLGDYVILRGNLPNAMIIEEMRKHEIFLFTSDRYEGWGAVANEAMSNGCALVASSKIGSVPFLVKDGENGLIFKSGSLKSMEKKVKMLLDKPELIDSLSKTAMKTMREVWSPQQAAISFLNLVNYIIDDRLDDYQVFEGPASWN